MAASRSSRAYSNLQVESIRWQKSAIPPGSTGSFLILDEDGIVTFGQDAILNSLSLQNLNVTQGITTGSLTVLAGATIGGNLKVTGSMTAQNVTATNSLTAVNGTVTNLQVTGTLIVDGGTFVPSGTSIIAGTFIYAGATTVTLSSFNGYNLDVSGSAYFGGGLTLGGPLVATNSVIARGATAQVVFEAPAGGVVGTIQGLAGGMYIESNQAVKFSNLDESAGDILTINPIGPTVTVGSGVTLNVQGIGGSGLTVTPPTVFTGTVTTNGSLVANGVVTAGATLQVNGFIDAQGGIKNSLPGGVLNLNDSVAVTGILNTQSVIQQGSVLGAGGLLLQIQPTAGQVAIGNAGNTVTVLGPLVTAGLTSSTANFSGLITGYGGLTTTTGFFSSGVTVAGDLTTNQYLSALTGAYIYGTRGLMIESTAPPGITLRAPGSGNGIGIGYNSVEFAGGNMEIVIGTGSVGNGGGLNIWNTTGPAGYTANDKIFVLDRLGNLTLDGYLTIPGITASVAKASGLIVSDDGTKNLPSNTTGLFIGQGLAQNPHPLFDSNGALMTWNAVSDAGNGNFEIILGTGNSAGGGMKIYNTIGGSLGTTSNQNIFALDRVGNLALLGGLTVGGSLAVTSGTISQGAGAPLSIQPSGNLNLASGGGVVTIGSTSSGNGVISQQFFTANNGAFVGGSNGLQIGDFGAGLVVAPTGGNGAAIGWNSVEPNFGNMEIIIGEGNQVTGGGLNVWNTTGPGGNTANSKIFALDRVGNLKLAGGLTATTGYFSSGLTVNGGVGSNTTPGIVFNSPVATQYGIGPFPTIPMITTPNYSFNYLFPPEGFTAAQVFIQPWNLPTTWFDSYQVLQSSVLNGYVAPINGVYQIGAYVEISAVDTNASFKLTWTNGPASGSFLSAPMTPQTSITSGTATFLVKLNAGDTVFIDMSNTVYGSIPNVYAQMWGYLLHAL
jgi:hypothetical protein